ncbi:unnamed protein product, partial [Mesorhabditis belari]|uniref:Uncharacterized protein n=1 Tax=Mesorhabditis belari TaxID=2138241 RepID=A0AAF3EIR8_9BILA
MNNAVNGTETFISDSVTFVYSFVLMIMSLTTIFALCGCFMRPLYRRIHRHVFSGRTLPSSPGGTLL